MGRVCILAVFFQKLHSGLHADRVFIVVLALHPARFREDSEGHAQHARHAQHAQSSARVPQRLSEGLAVSKFRNVPRGFRKHV